MSRINPMIVAGALFVATLLPVGLAGENGAKGVAGDGEKAAAYLHSRSGSDGDLLALPALIRQLNSESFAQRQNATKRLIALGPAAFAALRPLLRDKDLEAARRAQECVKTIDKNYSSIEEEAAVRAVLAEGSEEAVKTLVRFLPYAADEEFIDWL